MHWPYFCLRMGSYNFFDGVITGPPDRSNGHHPMEQY